MIKKNKWTVIFSSLVILLPMLFGVFGKSVLPPEFVIHWGADGTPDGMGSARIFFILPPILLAVHWLCILTAAVFDKELEQSKKLYRLVLWIAPALSLFANGMIFATAQNASLNPIVFVYLLLAITFVVIGNYMPKIKRSLTAGIKIKWALASDENWYATHRFSGKVYVVMGFLCLVAIPLPVKAFPFAVLGIILIGVLLPVIYSYRFYQKQLASGELTKEEAEKNYGRIFKHKKTAVAVTVVLTLLIAVLLPILMLAGKIELAATDTALTVDASFGYDTVLDFDKIESAEYRAQGVKGQRLYGFGSAKLLLGTFQNEEFGSYARYTYTGDCPCIVLKMQDRTVVIGIKDEARLQEIYDIITQKIAQ